MAAVLKTVGIIVKDMRKTLEFYRILGIGIPEGSEGEDNVDVVTEGGMVLGFLTEELARQADPMFVTPVGQSLNLQFECAAPEEVDAVFAKLVAAGYGSYAEPWNAFWGQRFARVSDPDNRTVNLYASLRS